MGGRAGRAVPASTVSQRIAVYKADASGFCRRQPPRAALQLPMTNQFYNAFDCETYGGPRKTDYRNAFQIDRDRIIHAHAFRKLQSKTQVFLSGEYDFYRTRLTHSMEVAQIGRSICHFLRSVPGPCGRTSSSTATWWRPCAWRTIWGTRPSGIPASARSRS